MKKDNKTICSYCGQRFNSDTMKYGLCSDCYEMIIRLGYENRIDYKKELIKKTQKKIVNMLEELISLTYEEKEKEIKELNDFYNYLNN